MDPADIHSGILISVGLPKEVIVLPEVSAVAERVAALLLSQRLRHPDRCLGLATGRTMEPVYRSLVGQFRRLPPAQQRRVRQQWRSYNLDDFLGIGAEHPGSFAATMRRWLIEPLELDERQVLLPDGMAPDPEAEARRYADALKLSGGIGLQLLGLGQNGHLGFNEPPSPADAPCRCVDLRTPTRRQNAQAFGGDPEAVPERAITLGMAEILAADRILLVVTGVAKARVLRRTFDHHPPGPELPASWLKNHPDVILVTDMAAMGSGNGEYSSEATA